MESLSGSIAGDGPPHEREDLERKLLAAIKHRRDSLVRLLDEATGHWGYEDPVYRFYHQSFKVYALQDKTGRIIGELQDLLPGRDMNPWFLQIVAEGTGHRFDMSCNQDWPRHTRSIVEAFFHARFMLEMAVRDADLEEAAVKLPADPCYKKMRQTA